MRSPMRCSVPNRVCSEVLSFRVSLEGRDQASLSSLANPKTGLACGPVSIAPRWRLCDGCERDQRKLSGVACFGDHVGHREVGAEPVTDAALDLGVAVGQVGVEAR